MNWFGLAGLAAEFVLRWLLNRVETDKDIKKQRDEANRELFEAKKNRNGASITAARIKLRHLRR